MIAAAARYGYGGASVERVIEHAGVSRATFYEQFDDREGCFLAVCRAIARRIEGDVRRIEQEQRADDRPRQILTKLLSAADRNPAVARLVLIEGLAAGQAVRAEHERLFGAIEQAIARYFESGSEEGSSFDVPPRAILGGVAAVIAIRVFRGETGQLTDLRNDLLAWVDAYRKPSTVGRKKAPSWAKLGAETAAGARALSIQRLEPGALPPGHSALLPGAVAGDRRTRILDAAARIVSERGYAAVTVADIVAEAGVNREIFYAQFRSKEDAFLAVQTMALQESIAMAAGEFFGSASWPDRVWGGLQAMLTYIESRPDLAWAEVVESFAAGPAAIRRSFDSRMAYTLFLEDGYRQRPEAAGLSRLCSEAIGGAVLELLRHRVAEGKAGNALELLPQMAYVVLTPFIGPGAAFELVEGKIAAQSISG